ncbi:MAG: alpha,alpha-trehalase [Alphaproteobacteria bacterium]|nr:alpha,alpha-trehalase [Alphaproteobacteria bacterium]
MSHSAKISPSLKTYIRSGWEFLRRSPLDPAPDPKTLSGAVSFLYIPAHEDKAKIEQRVRQRREKLRQIRPNAAFLIDVEVRYLPVNPQNIPDSEHGLLYLPNDYIVPGGRFNEMYGWDSYWIIRGLVDDGQTGLAKGMIENLFYQIEHYGGKILNANRTYYLSRSNPPLLGLSIEAVAAPMDPDERRAFLQRATPLLETESLFWRAWRFVPETGLFRYGHPDMGKLGPCPEVRMGEIDVRTGQNHYDKVLHYLKQLETTASYRRFYDREADALTIEALAGDRGVRESGFDPSMSMGFFGLETLDMNPVCLNALLCVQFGKLASFYHEIGNEKKSRQWKKEHHALARRIRAVLWNEEKGLFFSYNHRTKAQSDFAFLTTFYPLFAGIATRKQAQKLRRNLGLFEATHGLMATPERTGCQWDGPHMWAPLVYFAVQGLVNYGFEEDACRIARKFLDTVQKVYDEEGGIYEKYDAETGSNKALVSVGYKENVIGFGWTNATAQWIDNLLKSLEAGSVTEIRALPWAQKTVRHSTTVPSEIFS